MLIKGGSSACVFLCSSSVFFCASVFVSVSVPVSGLSLSLCLSVSLSLSLSLFPLIHQDSVSSQPRAHPPFCMSILCLPCIASLSPNPGPSASRHESWTWNLYVAFRAPMMTVGRRGAKPWDSRAVPWGSGAGAWAGQWGRRAVIPEANPAIRSLRIGASGR